jgi:hypothetical protein
MLLVEIGQSVTDNDWAALGSAEKLGEENSRRSSLSPARSWSSSGTCSATPPPGSATSAPNYHTTRINTERRTRNYVTQLIAMGYRVTLEPAA